MLRNAILIQFNECLRGLVRPVPGSKHEVLGGGGGGGGLEMRLVLATVSREGRENYVHVHVRFCERCATTASL